VEPLVSRVLVLEELEALEEQEGSVVSVALEVLALLEVLVVLEEPERREEVRLNRKLKNRLIFIYFIQKTHSLSWDNTRCSKL
jgi:hypothetical protein